MKKYKRLTDKNWKDWIEDDFYTSACNLNHKEVDKLICRLAELEDKIENGTLVELPCKVGDIVYFVNDYRPTPKIEEYVVYGIMLNSREIILYIDFMEAINAKNVYFTKAEAENKIKELQNER